IAVEETPPASEAEFRARRSAGEKKPDLGRILSAVARRSRTVAALCGFHKILRRSCVALLLPAFVANACLSDEPFYLRLLLLHEAVYVLALIALFAALGDQCRRVMGIPWRLAVKLGSVLYAAVSAPFRGPRRVAAPNRRCSAAKQVVR